jgi:hypothetical protein
MKKYSDSPITKIVILGDGRYEFCFNNETKIETNEETMAEKTSYVCDIVVCEGVIEKGAIVAALLSAGKTEIEANELVENLVV